MVRLMLVLAPIACVLSAIAVSTTLKTYSKFLKRRPNAKPKKGEAVYAGQKEIAWVVITGISILLIFYTFHCTWVCRPLALACPSAWSHFLIASR